MAFSCKSLHMSYIGFFDAQSEVFSVFSPKLPILDGTAQTRCFRTDAEQFVRAGAKLPFTSPLSHRSSSHGRLLQLEFSAIRLVERVVPINLWRACRRPLAATPETQDGIPILDSRGSQFVGSKNQVSLTRNAKSIRSNMKGTRSVH